VTTAEQQSDPTVPVPERTPRDLPPSPKIILRSGWKYVKDNKIAGASTATIVALDGATHILRATNIGDSGFIVIRPDRTVVRGSLDVVQLRHKDEHKEHHEWVVFRSPQQLHEFNRPFQMALGPKMEADLQTPEDAQNIAFRVQKDDIIVLGSDGLFDNVFENDLVALCRLSSTPEQIASRLLERAYLNSIDRDTDGPFAVMAKDEGVLWRYGGHRDDITVVVAKVV